ncbi:putative ABC transporter permease [Candidatus Pacearchaeota archaeon]|nr:putative ABC transporter permease [Candidatus Pacearchaeota archaeon]
MIGDILIIFIVASFAGWVIEFAKYNFFSKYKKLINPDSFKIFGKKFFNPGFLKGPYLPIYGFGALSIIVISFLEINLFIKLILFFFSNVFIELLSGLILLNYFGLRLWKYDKLDYKGIICLSHSIYFFIASVLFYFCIFPHYYVFLNFIKSSFLIYVIGGLYFFFFIDSIIRLKRLKKINLKKIKK